jgi:hypothetical protein
MWARRQRQTLPADKEIDYRNAERAEHCPDH